ncbi:MAG: dockerin type I domain-containing protein [Planctomycetota bacterium]
MPGCLTAPANLTALRRRGPAAGLALLLSLVLCSTSAADVTYTLSNNWPTEQRRQAAIAAMDAAVEVYNRYGAFDIDLSVTYNAAVPTADGNINGSIRWGGMWPNTPIALHEIAHTVGVGIYGEWYANLQNNRWTGPAANALVQQFDGIGTVLNADGNHFWPYGLNFTTEDSLINRERHVAMVHALRIDMGRGPQGHPSPATNVLLTGDDPVGTSGFNYNGNWSDGYFARPGANYATNSNTLRTPESDRDFRFAGNALNVNGGRLMYRGRGNGTRVIVDQLVLQAGEIVHNSPDGDASPMRLEGNLTIIRSGTLSADAGAIDVYSAVHGDGLLTIALPPAPDFSLDTWVRFYSGQNTFDGNIEVDTGRFRLARDANLNFTIGGAGENNTLAGAASAVLLEGVLDLDLSAASTTPGDSWELIATANTRYTGTFRVDGFDNLGGGLWSDGVYEFAQSTGVLSVIGPPPLAGDFNGDGMVDGADYAQWRNTLNQTGAGLAADANGDNRVDADDLAIWQANFGTPAQAATLAATQAVPEPAAGVLAAVLAAAGTLAQRRTRAGRRS